MTLSSYIRGKIYRISTMLNACKAIYFFSPDEVNAFVKSYDIYNCHWKDGHAVDGTKPVNYDKVKKNILNWYTVINHLCAVGEVEKMYIPPLLNPSENIINNQNLFEARFCEQLDLKPNDQVFELGCGKGRVAAHIAGISGAHIIGINIDQGQLDSATQFAKDSDLTKQCQFVNADFNDLPFPYPDNHFDAIYEIQVLSLSRDLTKLFKELRRILKPGGKISLLEWVRLPKYDDTKPQHRRLMKKIKPLIGAIGTPSPAEYETALRKAGFKILISEDPSVDKTQEPLIRKANGFFAKLSPIFNLLVSIRVLPKHFITLFSRLSKDTEALCKADKMGLVTMCYHLVAQKPRAYNRREEKQP